MFLKKVFTAVDTLTVNKIRSAILRTESGFEPLFKRFDKDRDNRISYQEFEDMTISLGLNIATNNFNRICEVLDRINSKYI